MMLSNIPQHLSEVSKQDDAGLSECKIALPSAFSAAGVYCSLNATCDDVTGLVSCSIMLFGFL